MDVQARKKQIRAEMRSRIEALSKAEVHHLSISACERLTGGEGFQSARTVMLYLPMAGELDTTPIALRAFQLGQIVCAPRMNWEHKRILPMEINCFETGFETRRYGVREPVEMRPVPLEEIDLIIIPGLAFDAVGGRLGRGGGYYDRFLSRAELRPDCAKWGIAYDFQVVEETPILDHDAQLDAVYTDRRSIAVRRRSPA